MRCRGAEMEVVQESMICKCSAQTMQRTCRRGAGAGSAGDHKDAKVHNFREVQMCKVGAKVLIRCRCGAMQTEM